uniref:Uncharacterized protein n=1 Tax=Glossina palpalis gambiensis TaxID=67801 RepID=A0A1B0BVJ5_9MUSC
MSRLRNNNVLRNRINGLRKASFVVAIQNDFLRNDAMKTLLSSLSEFMSLREIFLEILNRQFDIDLNHLHRTRLEVLIDDADDADDADDVDNISGL